MSPAACATRCRTSRFAVETLDGFSPRAGVPAALGRRAGAGRRPASTTSTTARRSSSCWPGTRRWTPTRCSPPRARWSATLAELTHSSQSGLLEISRDRGVQGDDAGPVVRASTASTRPTSSPSATCRTTCRCWPGRARRTPWRVPTPTCWPRCEPRARAEDDGVAAGPGGPLRPLTAAPAASMIVSGTCVVLGAHSRSWRAVGGLQVLAGARSPGRSPGCASGARRASPAAGAPPHLLELCPRRHLLGEQRRLDAVEQPLQPADQLGLGDPQLRLARHPVVGERQREPLQLLDQLGREALLELLDRAGVDLLEPGPARLVQRRRRAPPRAAA